MSGPGAGLWPDHTVPPPLRSASRFEQLHASGCNINLNMVNPNASGITYRRNETTAPGVFLNATDLRANAKRWFSCRASELGLERGHFPGRLETDAGNGVAFKLDRPLYDEEGKFTGVVYRQSGRLRGVCFARLSRPHSKPASICRTRLARAASVDRMGAGREPLYPAKQMRVDPIKGRLQRRPSPPKRCACASLSARPTDYRVGRRGRRRPGRAPGRRAYRHRRSSRCPGARRS